MSITSVETRSSSIGPLWKNSISFFSPFVVLGVAVVGLDYTSNRFFYRQVYSRKFVRWALYAVTLAASVIFERQIKDFLQRVL